MWWRGMEGRSRRGGSRVAVVVVVEHKKVRGSCGIRAMECQCCCSEGGRSEAQKSAWS